MKLTYEKSDTEPLRTPHGELVYELIGRAPEHGGAGAHSLAQIVIPPGKASRLHYHKICEESYYLLKGKARMILEEQEFSLSPGEAVLISPGKRHQIINTGDNDLEFLAVCVPAWYPGDSYIEESLNGV